MEEKQWKKTTPIGHYTIQEIVCVCVYIRFYRPFRSELDWHRAQRMAIKSWKCQRQSNATPSRAIAGARHANQFCGYWLQCWNGRVWRRSSADAKSTGLWAHRALTDSLLLLFLLSRLKRGEMRVGARVLPDFMSKQKMCKTRKSNYTWPTIHIFSAQQQHQQQQHIDRKPADIPKTQDRINGIDRLVDTDNRQDTPPIAKENHAHTHTCPTHIINISIENARVRPAHITMHEQSPWNNRRY